MSESSIGFVADGGWTNILPAVAFSIVLLGLFLTLLRFIDDTECAGTAGISVTESRFKVLFLD